MYRGHENVASYASRSGPKCRSSVCGLITQGLNQAHVTIEKPLVRKATGYHVVNPTSLEKIQRHVYGFCYARNRECNGVSDYVSRNRPHLVDMHHTNHLEEMEMDKHLLDKLMDW